jgi:hypothetical protein
MGRPRGSKNRKTILREQALAAAPMTPIEFLQSVMQSPDVDPKLRVEAAKIAAVYIHKPATAKPAEDHAPRASSARGILTAAANHARGNPDRCALRSARFRLRCGS